MLNHYFILVCSCFIFIFACLFQKGSLGKQWVSNFTHYEQIFMNFMIEVTKTPYTYLIPII